jgi:cytochrome c biogenesis protein CcmG, thiol:disulfide interchange protein DsbE
MKKRKLLFLGILSPIAAIVFYILVYNVLTALSSNLEKDWLFRLTASTLAMTIPFFVMLVLSIRASKQNAFPLPAKIGMTIAALSLLLTLMPIRDGLARAKQTRNRQLHDVAAPDFATTDLHGNAIRLSDYKGKVVLINIWATWCEPCRSEMPKLDRLYRDNQSQGFVVLGMSDESVATQQKFLSEVPVTYPLLLVNDQTPQLYREIAQYPAFFLIDREGRLQPAPAPRQPFEQTASAVAALLAAKP